MSQSKDFFRKGLLAMSLLGLVGVVETCEAQSSRLQFASPQYGLTTPGTKVLIFGDGFASDAEAYFGGMAARETRFVHASTLEVVTPYLRPGDYPVQVKSARKIAVSAVTFTSVPSPVDSKIDAALSLAERGEISAGIRELDQIAQSDPDYHVRAFAQYAKAKIFFAHGDWQNWSDACLSIYLHAKESGMSIQTYWPYRLESARAYYLTQYQTGPSNDFLFFDIVVNLDVTGNPEPRFYRALLNARAGKLAMAKADIAFTLAKEPRNASYAALAAFIAALGGAKLQSEAFGARARALLEADPEVDGRALSLLGETAYISRNLEQARSDWAGVGHIYPLGSGIALLAGKKHLWRGEPSIAAMLLSESIAMAQNTAEVQEARGLLDGIPESSPGQIEANAP